jgi:segregation and condensation protein B
MSAGGGPEAVRRIAPVSEAEGDPASAESRSAGFDRLPDDSGLSIDRLAQAFAAMMGGSDPYGGPAKPLVQVDASPDLDEAGSPVRPAGVAVPERVSPLSILEALLFVGLPGGEPLSSRRIAGLMRGVRPQEIDDLAADLALRYRGNNCPYEVVSKADGWVMRLRPEFRRLGQVLEAKTRRVRLDGESLDLLAVVAWNQPVPRERLAELGCDASPAVARQLIRRGLLMLVNEPAREGEEPQPCYRTTAKFLEVFRLRSLDDLPSPTDPPR